MKKLLFFTLLGLPLLYSAQTSKQNSSSKSALKLKVERSEKMPKPVVTAGTAAYSALKKQGKLYQYDINPGKTQMAVLPQNNVLTAKTTSLTYCDYIPYVGPTAYNTEVDDSPLATVPLQFSFCFYGVTYNSLNISANGNVQFSTNSTAFSATGFPSNAVNMIAPFWADGETMVVSGGFTYGKIKVVSNPTHMIISWDSIGYFNNHVDKLNSFQLILTDGNDVILPPGKNVGFKYRKMEWTTGDASGGTGGFPATQPGTPATIGMNAGNNIDYFLIGRFGIPGTSYDGPLGNSDGISWLNGKSFYFDACPPIGANVAPVSLYEIQECDTMRVCGNDTLIISNTFIGPEVTQTVSIVVTSPTLGSALSYFITANNNSAVANIMIDGSVASAGNHIITMTATDNGSPIGTSTQQFVVNVNHGSLSNLMGSVAITPTVGACPGGVVSASVNVTGGMPDSYLWSNGFTTPTTSYTTAVAADSLIYVTLTSGLCQKTIIGDININPVPVASISGNLSYCNGDAASTVLTATNTLNPSSQGPHTYSWAASSGTLSSANTASTSATGGVYTVTVTNQFGCVSVATTTVVMRESPSYTLNSANAISSGSVYCVDQDSARIGISFGGGAPTSCGLATSPCAVSSTVQIGTATTQGSGGAYTPYEGLYESARHQYLIRASELLAAGVTPGKLNSLAFRVTNLNGNSTAFDNFSIKLKCVTYNTVQSTLDNSGLSQVYGPNNINAFVGINTYNFAQAYEWDGTSNLLVDVCFFNQSWDGNINVQYTNVGYIASRYVDDDGSDQCPVTASLGSSQNRPNMIFGNCNSQQSGSQFNVVVTPTTGVVIPASNDSIQIDLPSTSGISCYTVTLTSNLGNCSKDTVICVETVQGLTQGTLATSSASVCPGGTVSLSAQGTLTSYTIQYTDNAGLQTTTVSPVTFNAPTITGAYVYSLSATGPCGGPLTMFTNTIEVIQGVTEGTLSVSSPSVCPGSPVTLSALGSLASYTIAYVDANGNSQVSVNSPITFVPASIASPVFGTHTYSLIAAGPCSGPVTTFTNSVEVMQGITNAALVATPSVVCIGSPITLTVSPLDPVQSYTITYNNGVTLNSINNAASFNTTVTGLNVFTLSAQGFCSAPVNTYTVSAMVNSLTTLTIAPIADVIKCMNGSATLTVNVATSSAEPYTYNWTPAVGTNTNTTYITSTPVTTTFVVTVNGVCANTATASVIVSNFPTNVNIIIPDSAAVCATTEFELNSVVTGGRAPYVYSWVMFPGLSVLSTSAVLSTAGPQADGTYSIMVTATDSCGFSDNDIQVITVLPACEIVIANIITPNGDGSNDFFKIKNIEYHPNSSLTIFDRWGKKVFSSGNYMNEWKAEGLNDGTYFYVLDVPEDKKYNGFVQVLR
ncbi:MAG: hypothetical protein K0R26_274 [Bacteroidota bacterium]|jgi:gliding motility-associated-like protein|nr:hypothetical protein [Bacteroidota bacterium]